MLTLQNITKRFGQTTAVDHVSLSIPPGEFLTLLGPSGCGKTTLLRTLSGLERPDAGRILLDSADITHLPPYRRPTNQVFQSYALFPHLSVYKNIAFGLKMQRLPRAEIHHRVTESLSLVELTGLEHRKPHQLSGGQRQRVALARALVNRPKLLLLDEPLAALDARLRHTMQLELKRLQQRLGITFIFVTHDQSEALLLSDRIAVMNQGRLEQLATPHTLYHHPATEFTARFIGHANLLTATVTPDGQLQIQDLTLPSPQSLPPGSTTTLLVRPEHITIHPTPPPKPTDGNPWVPPIPARLIESHFTGPTTHLHLQTPGGLTLHALLPPTLPLPPTNSTLHLSIPPSALTLLPPVPSPS